MNTKSTPSFAGSIATCWRQLHSWQQAGQDCWLAVVVATWGNSPCPPGSVLVFNDKQQFQGSVSGGCIEAAVITTGITQLHGNKGKFLQYGVSDNDAWAVGLACGGKIEVYLQKLAKNQGKIIKQIVSQHQQRNEYIIALQDDCINITTTPWQQLLTKVDQRQLPARQQNAVILRSEATVYIRYRPGLRLLLVGAAEIAQYLVQIARQLHWQVTVIDPRQGWANTERFPDVDLVLQWPDEFLQQQRLDEFTALVTLAHDPKIDDPALIYGVTTAVGYLGALGSQRTHSQRCERLLAMGITHEQLQRIHAPIGLRIGAADAGEIAVAIAAELIENYRTGSSGHRIATTSFRKQAGLARQR